MSIFNFWKRKTKGNNVLDTDDRALGLDIRRTRGEIVKQKLAYDLEMQKLKNEMELIELRARIAELKEEVGGGGDNTDEMIMSLMQKVLSGNPQLMQPKAPINPPKTINSQSESLTLSAAQIEEMLDKIPKPYRKIAKKFSDDEIKIFLKQQFPTLSPDSMDETIRILREKF